MASSKTPGAAGFDLERLQQLVELMEQFDLREVKLQKGEEKWFLRRGPQEVVSAAPVAATPAIPVPQASPAAQAPTAAPESSAPVDDGLSAITSPMVGTFYRSPSPDEPVFVKEGDRVTPDTVVCLIEAMKFFNQVKAECSGTIEKILLQDGDAVEFGQPLFKVKPG